MKNLGYHFAPLIRNASACVAYMLLSLAGFAQAPELIMAPGSVSYCNAILLDPGGHNNYPNNQNITMVLCPGNWDQDPDSRVQLLFRQFFLGSGDSLRIYDGPDASFPLLNEGATHGQSLVGVWAISTHSSGCLTLVFTSNASGVAPGWSALVACSSPCVPPLATITPTGLIGVCPNEELMVSVDTLITAPGRSVRSLIWDSGVGIVSGREVGLVYSDGGQYAVGLTVVDDIGCYAAVVGTLDVRVPLAPDFVGTTITPREACEGDTVRLSGVVNGHEWNDMPRPIIAGVTVLPDGRGVSYSTSIAVEGFPEGTIISELDDILRVCMVIEHSWLGDLVATLTAPNGRTVVLFDGYNGGGGSTFLGDPIDTDGVDYVPGVGWQYCFSHTAGWGTLMQENQARRHVISGSPEPGNSMQPGNYTSEGGFGPWIGSQLNGLWTITITDHLNIDDGTIFSWWFDVDESLYPDLISFTPEYPERTWTTAGVSPTIDGAATAAPPAGEHAFVFSVVDDFGCSWDTTLSVRVHPAPLSFDTGAVVFCKLSGAYPLFDHLVVQDTGRAIPTGGAWRAPNGTVHTGLFDPLINAPGAYTYNLGLGTICPSIGTVQVTVQAAAHAGNDVDAAWCSSDDPVDLFMLLGEEAHAGGRWYGSDSAAFGGIMDPAVDTTGFYYYVVDGTEPCPNDTALVAVRIATRALPGVGTNAELCRDAAPLDMLTLLDGEPDTIGFWTNAAGVSVSGLIDPATSASGVYTYTIVPEEPCEVLSVDLDLLIRRLPVAGMDTTLALCINAPGFAMADLLGEHDPGGVWTAPNGAIVNGVLDPTTDAAGVYNYAVNGEGACAHILVVASVELTINPVPVIEFDVSRTAGCTPLEVTFTNLSDSSSMNGNCVWNFGDGSAAVNSCDAVTYLYTEPGWYHVRLRTTTPEGCTDEFILQGAVLADPAPLATFNWGPEVASPSQPVISFIGTDPQATLFRWTFHDGDTISGRTVTKEYMRALSGAYEVCLEVRDRYGCMDVACNTVTLEAPSVFLPNTFTPNGDGINDVFVVHATGVEKNNFQFTLYDRWGKVIFETQEIGAVWDGRHSSGKPAAMGAYVWTLRARTLGGAEEFEMNGFLDLVR